MCFTVWRRKSFRKKARTGLLRHRHAVRNLAAAVESVKTAQAYNPVCIGGLEDRFAWIDQAEASVALWYRERERTEKFLGASCAQITRLRRLAKKHGQR